MSQSTNTERPAPDRVLTDIADYVFHYEIQSELAYTTARFCLMDSLGCAFEALEYPACTRLLGPIVPGTVVPNGAKVPGTNFELDPIQAAFNLGTMIRWLDFNDTWLAAEWGPSLGQPRRHPRRSRLALPQCPRARPPAAHDAPGPHGDD